MFLKVSRFKNGRTFLSAVEGYRDNGKVKQRTIQKFGFLDQLSQEFDDPVSHFKDVVVQMNAQNKKDPVLTLKIDPNATIPCESNLLNLGHVVLKRIYDQTGLPAFFSAQQKKLHCDFNLNQIFSFLVFSRILYPASKRATFENRKKFPHNYDFTLDDVYRALSFFDAYSDKIQECIWENTKEPYHRDTFVSYYDCTNYYFEIENNDDDVLDADGNIIKKGLRKRGPEKNHRPDPIVEMGLLMDSRSIPIAMDLFPGNESEKLSLRPILARVRNDYNVGRTVVVADRGLNTSDNIFYLSGINDTADSSRDGYVYGQSVRGADREFREWVTGPGYHHDDIIENGETIRFIHKSRKFGKAIKIERDGKRKHTVTIYQKQMAYYSEKYARKQKRDREKMIEKARSMIKDPGSYTRATSYGAAGYIQNLEFDKDTGEILTKDLVLNEERIREEEKYDGYYAIVTSEMELSDIEIRNIYRGLAKIEESFKITKSELHSRPVYVSTDEHIKGHFITCFVALTIIRMLEQRLKNRYPVGQIIQSLRDYVCTNIESNHYQCLYYDEIIKSCEEEFGLELNRKYITKEKIRRLSKY